MQRKILVADDERNILLSLRTCLEGEGYDVVTVPNGQGAIERSKEALFDLALVDLRMKDLSGLDVLREIKKISPDTTVVIITAYGAIDTAVQAMKEGAYDYLTKPFSPEQIRLFVKKIFERQDLVKEVRYLKDELQDKYKFRNIIGYSESMQRIFSLTKTVAKTDVTILIQGASGTGKELIAHAIHQNSERAENVFITVNCAAIPEALLESELFGHVKGAFTGAIKDKIGRFQLADKGSIFLDEIAEFSPSLQVKLLRVLQQREFERVGDSQTIKVDVRIIAATNRDLKEALRNGDFREDLYYRLNVVNINLPPLRERKEDIPILAKHFLEKYSRKNKKDVTSITEDTMQMLIDYDWPGNVRELENVVERGIILTSEKTLVSHVLPEPIRESKKGIDIKRIVDSKITLDELEREYIKGLLKEIENKEKVAQILGIDTTTLWRKREKYGLG